MYDEIKTEMHSLSEHNFNQLNVINSKKSKRYATELLIFLYSLQGLVIGLLLETLQLRLKTYFNYSEIGIFLLCSYPFSLKILWSPIIDTYYLKSIGLRKTWIILSQLICAAILFLLSMEIDEILE